MVRNNEDVQLVPTSQAAHLIQYPYEFFNPAQSAFFPHLYEVDKNVVITSPTGSGKAQPLDVDIQTPSGPKKMGDIKVGDVIYTASGNTTEVTGVFPQGKKEVYRVTFADGRSTRCCAEHLWQVWDGYATKYRTMTLAEIMNKPAKKRAYQVPLYKPQNINQDIELPIHPYILGILITEGCLTGITKGTGTYFCTSDKHVVDKVRCLLDSGYHLTEFDIKSGCSNYRLSQSEVTMSQCTGASPNKYTQGVISLGLNCYSYDKFIPDVYLSASYEQRLELARGLIDGDGYAGMSLQFSTSSEKLALDFQRLVWSLGGICKISAKKPTYTHKGEKRVGRTAYICNIRHPQPKTLCSSPKHLNRLSDNYQYGGDILKLRIQNIELIGEAECQCIMVDDESHLYVTDDYIVTHNTVMAELSVAVALEQGKSAMYIAPMKSLAEEKLDDWRNESHPFSRRKICVLTGDHEFTKQKLVELENADIILCTSEMLDSKTRNWNSNTWLHNIGVLVGDESHIVGAKKRGPCFETAIMRFCRNNTDCRIVLMSATVPNDSDYELWLNQLTGRPTQMVRSTYRPCALHMHYIPFNNTSSQYRHQENARADKVHELVVQSVAAGQSCLVFTGNKAWGRNYVRRLKNDGITAEFHNADLSLDRRKEIESTFNAEGYQVLVASSTLAWGVNINARNVILAHTSYGKSEMEVADILQAAGRAGRVKFHTEGDCYIILPHTTYEKERSRIEGGFLVQSQLTDIHTLMFHIVSEIHNENVKSIEDMMNWYSGSLAHHQNKIMNEADWRKVIAYLERIRMVKTGEDGVINITPLGSIASIMYQSPITMSDWYKNFGTTPHVVNCQDDGVHFCWHLADTTENRTGFLSTTDKTTDCITRYASRVGRMEPVTKYAAIYHALLNDLPIDDSLQSLANQMRNDIDRTFSTLYMMHDRYAKYVPSTPLFPGWTRWDKAQWLAMQQRMKYGVPASLVKLVSIDGIGKTYAHRLYAAGIRTKQDIIANKELFLSIVSGRKGHAIFDAMLKKP